MTGYDAIVAQAAALGWPVSFRRDLEVHDRSALEARPDDVFIWGVRETGTFLLTRGEMLRPERSRQNLRSCIEMCASADVHRDHRVFFWDGRKLWAVGPDEAGEIVSGWAAHR